MCTYSIVPVKVPLDVTTTEVFDLEGYNQYNDDQDDVDEHYHIIKDGMVNLRDTVGMVLLDPMRLIEAK